MAENSAAKPKPPPWCGQGTYTWPEGVFIFFCLYCVSQCASLNPVQSQFTLVELHLRAVHQRCMLATCRQPFECHHPLHSQPVRAPHLLPSAKYICAKFLQTLFLTRFRGFLVSFAPRSLKKPLQSCTLDYVCPA